MVKPRHARPYTSDPVLPLLLSSSSRVPRVPAVFPDGAQIRCGRADKMSCLSHSDPKVTLFSRKLQSQVPECLPKPCPPLPRWDVLTLVTLVFPSRRRASVAVVVPAAEACRPVLRVAHLLFFAPASSAYFLRLYLKGKKIVPLCAVDHSQIPPKQ